MLPPPMARPTAAESSCPVAASVSFISTWRPPAKTCLSVAMDWTALRRRICGTMTEMDRMPGVAASVSVIATWSLTTPGAGVVTISNCCANSFSRAPLKQVASACWSGGLTLVVWSPQNVTGSMMTLVYWRHCADGLKYRRPTWPFEMSPGVSRLASLPRKPLSGVFVTDLISVTAQPVAHQGKAQCRGQRLDRLHDLTTVHEGH